MNNSFKEANIAEIAMGAVVERMSLAMHNAIENIRDPNTDAKKTRTIDLKLKLTPDKDRKTIGYQILIKENLCPLEDLEGTLFIDRKNGRYIAIEQDGFQEELPLEVIPSNVNPETGELKEGTND